jgi:DNA polymerase I-like protein with 3'-5' exonuclease and polymerase domains
VLESLAGAGIDMRETGAGRWRGGCPSCGSDDRLTINTDLAGNVWLKCWSATCQQQDILNALGLTWRDLKVQTEPEAPSGPFTVKSSGVQTRSIRWPWKGRLAAGYLTVQTGLEGLGKSLFAAWMAGQASLGELPGDWLGQPRQVLIVAGEDSREDTWKPRLELVGHDPERVHFLALEKLGPTWNIRDGIDQLREAVTECAANIIIFDALLDHFPPARAGETANQPTFVREALYPLKLLVRELDAAAVMSLHPPKSRAAAFRDLVQMSQAFTAIPRVGLLFACHPDDDDSSPDYRRVVLRGKGNIGRDPGALEFRVVGKPFTHDDGRTTEREVVVDVKPSTVTKADLFARDIRRQPTKIELAMDTIRLALSGGEWTAVAPIRLQLETAGHNHNDTVNEATKRLGVEKEQRQDGWYWRLAAVESDDPPQSRNDDYSDSATLTPLARARSIPTPTLTPKKASIPSNDGQSRRVGVLEHPALFDDPESDGEVYRAASDSDPPEAAGVVYMDSETTGLDPRSDRLTWVGFAPDDGDVVMLRHPEDHDRIQAWLELDADYAAHNITFDMSFAACSGYRIPEPRRWIDTVLIAHVAGQRKPGETRLDRLQANLIKAEGLPASITEPEKTIRQWLLAARRVARKLGQCRPEKGDAPAHVVKPYLAADVITMRAVARHYGAVIDGQASALELERRCLPAIYAAECRGVPIDMAAAAELRDRTEITVGDLRARLFELAGHPFNPDAARQIEKAFIERGADLSRVPRTEKASLPQFTAHTLTLVDDELASVLLEYRAEKKLYDYVLALWRCTHGDRMFGTFHLAGTQTGRMSSGRPNLQNIPKSDLRVRYTICAGPEKVLVGADLDSVELRVLAAYARGGALERAFADGVDLHEQTASAVGVDRDQGKMLNYAILYGAGRTRIATELGCSEADAMAVLDRWYRQYPEVGRLKQRLGRRVRERGYLMTVSGRRHFIEPKREFTELNRLVSGTCADMFKAAIIELHRARVPAILYVHDEIVAEVHEDQADETAQLLTAALERGTGHIGGLKAQAVTARRWSDFKQPGYTP